MPSTSTTNPPGPSPPICTRTRRLDSQRNSCFAILTPRLVHVDQNKLSISPSHREPAPAPSPSQRMSPAVTSVSKRRRRARFQGQAILQRAVIRRSDDSNSSRSDEDIEQATSTCIRAIRVFSVCCHHCIVVDIRAVSPSLIGINIDIRMAGLHFSATTYKQ